MQVARARFATAHHNHHDSHDHHAHHAHHDKPAYHPSVKFESVTKSALLDSKDFKWVGQYVKAVTLAPAA